MSNININSQWTFHSGELYNFLDGLLVGVVDRYDDDHHDNHGDEHACYSEPNGTTYRHGVRCTLCCFFRCRVRLHHVYFNVYYWLIVVIASVWLVIFVMAVVVWRDDGVTWFFRHKVTFAWSSLALHVWYESSIFD